MLTVSRRAGAAAVLAVFAGACGREAAAPLRQPLAIQRFDNQSGDPSLDWMGRAMAELLAAQLGGTVVAPAPVQAARVTHGRFSKTAGRLRADVAVEDLRTHRRLRNLSAAGGSLLEIVGGIARQIDPAARPAPVRNEAALRFYALAVEAGNVETSANLLDQAIQADPDFGLPYLAAVAVAKTRGDRPALERYLAAAAARGAAIDERSRAFLAQEAAVLKGDAAAQRKALSELARLHPQDAARWRALGLAEALAGDHANAIVHLRRAVELDPADAQARNELGYSLALNGDLGAGIEQLREYQRLRPQEANPLDSLGDIHFLHRRFADAAKFYLDAHQRQPSFLRGAVLVKAALALHFAGDAARAGEAFARFAKTQADNPELPLWEAVWEAAVNRRDRAAARVEPLAARTDELGARARAHLFVLALERGDRAAAERYAKGVAPPALALLLAPDSLARLPQSAARDELLGLALMFAGKPAAAAEAFLAAGRRALSLQRLNNAILAAWCQQRAGRRPDPDLTRFAPVPQVTSPSPLTAVTYARLAR